ncbi:hypothetical protein JQ634_08110 [Bradyrhizobium sp. AUGA SZCCT0240]|uniref:hypothetical protein n=1 Tax=unclassified Bradyrhizobium TaxID=2631580 RepID=UPI001BAC8589|nr:MULTISPECIES: hypothetical protein [unclassified Bradyrhizobium]MBR1195296.1 hypothetical protein [Bradyrhizobium sp. AUGA SZCCT0158]MBR1238759.1 hypothetical protein [Bradyrhizobium sp. AUGA SZCCT0274]MBR1253664.1 hypothetical protein [Bradyrhizobium sp. AUGA SZCCT0240]
MNAAWVGQGCFMIYKGVEYTVTAVAPGIWKWQFRIDDRVITGKTEAKLYLLAVRRVQLRINRERKKKRI